MTIEPRSIEALRARLPEWEQRKIVHGDKIAAITKFDEGKDDASIRMTTPGGVYIHESWDWYTRHNPQVGGYFVMYKDGYTSYSPAEPFEAACVPVIPGAKDEFHFINEKWIEQFANITHGRYNTIRWGSPEIDVKLFIQLKKDNIEGDTKYVWLLGTHVARYFDNTWSSEDQVQQEIVNFMSPEPNEAKRAVGDMGMFMGCRIFADRNAHLPTKSILLLRFKGETVTGHKLSGVTL